MTAFDWNTLMTAGMRGLRLSPRQFWDLTPAELGLLLGQNASDGPLTRDRLEALSRAYPDGKGELNDG